MIELNSAPSTFPVIFLVEFHLSLAVNHRNVDVVVHVAYDNADGDSHVHIGISISLARSLNFATFGFRHKKKGTKEGSYVRWDQLEQKNIRNFNNKSNL